MPYEQQPTERDPVLASQEEITSSSYHFERIAEIEAAMIHLAEQLKENILNGEYDLLISDDRGGRIPTLVFKKVIDIVRPNQEVSVRFVANLNRVRYREYWQDEFPSGKYEGVERSEEYMKKITSQRTKKGLVITEYASGGDMLAHFAKVLEEVDSEGVYDIAVMCSNHSKTYYEEQIWGENTQANSGQIYIGEEEAWKRIIRDHDPVTGLTTEERDQQAIDLIPETKRGILRRKYGAEENPDTASRIQKNIIEARADVALLAKKIIKEVFNDQVT